jgi:hypothetical protein
MVHFAGESVDRPSKDSGVERYARDSDGSAFGVQRRACAATGRALDDHGEPGLSVCGDFDSRDQTADASRQDTTCGSQILEASG